MESESRKRPGPDPLYTIRIQLPITQKMFDALEALDTNRSAFIRQAIDRELKRAAKSPKP